MRQATLKRAYYQNIIDTHLEATLEKLHVEERIARFVLTFSH